MQEINSIKQSILKLSNKKYDREPYLSTKAIFLKLEGITIPENMMLNFQNTVNNYINMLQVHYEYQIRNLSYKYILTINLFHADSMKRSVGIEYSSLYKDLNCFVVSSIQKETEEKVDKLYQYKVTEEIYLKTLLSLSEYKESKFIPFIASQIMTNPLEIEFDHDIFSADLPIKMFLTLYSCLDLPYDIISLICQY